MIKIVDVHGGAAVDFPAFSKIYTGIIFRVGYANIIDVPVKRPTWEQAARDAGLMVGWYWFIHPKVKGKTQADLCVAALDGDFGELGLWGDGEKIIGTTDGQYWASAYAGYRNYYDFLARIKELSDNRVGFYTSPGFWNLINPPVSAQEWFAQFPLWEAHYTKAEQPMKVGAWGKNWKLWQKQGEPDESVYNGTDEEFYTDFGETPVPTPDPDPQPPGEITIQVIVPPGVKVEIKEQA